MDLPQPADRLLRLIKQAIEQSIARESKLQTFLNWLFQMSKSIQVTYKPAAIRAFYYTLDRALARALASARALTFDLALAHALALALDRARARAFDRDFDRALDLDLDFDRALARVLDRAHDLTLDRTFARALARDLAPTRALDLARDRDLDRILARTLDCDLDPKLISKLGHLRAELPASNQQRWQANGLQWVEQLRQVMIEHRNIGHNWQFTNEQKRQLERYYDGNKFLVDLMKIEGAVSDDVRAEIEDTLLLPWAELQRRQPEIYHDLQ